MIKTLRITSIVAVVLAAIFVIFFVLPVVFGVRSDEHIKELLNSPGVIEKFSKAVGNKATRSGNETSPLVQQAGTFALYLNPPAPKASRTPARRGAKTASGPAVTPKFKVIGTSYYKGRPELSLALIDEPGKGLHWVKQSGKIGHLLVEQIKDGLIVVKDNGRTYELVAEQKPEISLLKGASAVSSKGADIPGKTAGTAGSRPALPASGRTGADITDAGSRVPRSRRTAEENAKMKELVEGLRRIQRSFTSDKTGSRPSAEEKEAMMDKQKKLISEFRTSRLSAEETKKLSTLGKELKKVWEEPDSSVPEKNKNN